jgi:hypothetical protein
MGRVGGNETKVISLKVSPSECPFFWGKANMTLPELSPAISGKPMHGTSSVAADL